MDRLAPWSRMIVMTAIAPATRDFPTSSDSEASPRAGSVFVACPDARPPAYQAVVGFSNANLLDRFLTGFYYRDSTRFMALARQWAPCGYARWRRVLRRRHHPGIPADQVESRWGFDVSLRAEHFLERKLPGASRRLARQRTLRFDRQLADRLEARRPDVAFLFSDVGSSHSLPRCKELGIRSILSMVHGDVREERLVLEREAELSPDFFPIYLADGAVNRDELNWLHERRLRDIAQADTILVPSEHIAGWLTRTGTPSRRIRVVPYAADTSRFVPRTSKRLDAGSCTFLFAGGITQRKGIKYLLEAWRRIRRPGWRLQLLGGMPSNATVLEPYRDEVEWLGRVGHADVPAAMAAADVFVFPSLFEGSAVVTYEAIACGLPAIVTPSAGSVVRDGIEGIEVPPAEIEALAAAMERLGADPELRATMGRAARTRAEEFDWPRYQNALVRIVREVLLSNA